MDKSGFGGDLILCRAVTDDLVSKPFKTISSLGVYACARIVAEGSDNVMIAFAFDNEGRIAGEQLLTSGFKRSPSGRPELIYGLLDRTGAGHVVVACSYKVENDDDLRFIIEGCDGLIKHLAKRHAVLAEFILTDGFDYRFLISPEKTKR